MNTNRTSKAVMYMGHARKKSSRIKRPDEKRSDDELLKQIAHKDMGAFELFYARHSKAMFKVAYYITHDRQLAEDAVQEAILNLFESAQSYSPGNGRGWILSIVAHKSSKIIRGKTQQKKRVNELESRGESRKQRPEDFAEAQESRNVLRALLGKLPARDRQIMSLYYACGLSQYQIARELSISQRTVGFRIAKVITSLKADCTRAGLAAATLSGSEFMAFLAESEDALLEGADVRMLDVARSICDKQSVSSEKVARVPLLWALGCSAVLACVVGFTFSKTSFFEKEFIKADQVTSDDGRKLNHWTFKEGVPNGFEALFGTWRWKRDAQGRAGLDAPRFVTYGGLRLPLSNLETPFSLDISVRIQSLSTYLMAGWLDGEHRVGYTRHPIAGPESAVTEGIGALYKARFVFFDTWAIRYVNGQAVHMYSYDSKGSGLCIFAKNVSLISIAYKALNIEEERAKFKSLSAQRSSKFKTVRTSAFQWSEMPAPPQILGPSSRSRADQMETGWHPERWMPATGSELKKTLALPDEPSAVISWDPKLARIETIRNAGKMKKVLAPLKQKYAIAVSVPKEIHDFAMCEVLLRTVPGQKINANGIISTHVGVDWKVHGRELPSRLWPLERSYKPGTGEFIKVHFYMIGRFTALLVNGYAPFLNEYRRPLDFKNGQLIIRIEEAEVIGLSWHGVDAKRLPAVLRDLRSLPLTTDAVRVELMDGNFFSPSPSPSAPKKTSLWGPWEPDNGPKKK